ncbi:MAG: hypothetical protein ACLPTJ_16645 [Solirubrobacteraceae bacterium]
MGRWFAVAACGSTEAEFTGGRVEVWVIPEVGIGRPYWGIE